MISEETNLAIHQIVNPSISFIGCILCLLSFLVYRNQVFHEKFFTHIRIEIVFMLITLTIVCLQPIYYQEERPNSLFSGVYYIFFIIYAKSVLEAVVLFSNIFTDVHFLIFITNHQQQKFIFANRFLKKHHSFVLTLIALAFNSMTFSYQFCKYHIIQVDVFMKSSNSSSVWNSTNSSLVSNSRKAWNITQARGSPFTELEIISLTFRDGLGLTILLTVNFILFYQIKRVMKQKMLLLKCNILKSIHVINNEVDCESCARSSAGDHSNQERVKNRRKIDKAQTKLTVAISLSSLKCLIARLPIFTYFILQALKDSEHLVIDDLLLGFIYALACFSVYFSYSVSFFFYYQANSLFRKIVKAHLLKLRNKCFSCNI